jgi:hypothetical protein
MQWLYPVLHRTLLVGNETQMFQFVLKKFNG